MFDHIFKLKKNKWVFLLPSDMDSEEELLPHV